MTHPAAPGPGTTTQAEQNHGHTPTGPAQGDLAWLLDDLVGGVVGIQCAVLVSRDGLKLAAAGLDNDRADKAAAMVATFYSLGKGVAEIPEPAQGSLRVAMVQHDARRLYIMSAPDPDDLEVALQRAAVGSAPFQIADGHRVVGAMLGVFAAPDADSGPISYQMETLLLRVAAHLATPTRTAPTGTSEGSDRDR